MQGRLRGEGRGEGSAGGDHNGEGGNSGSGDDEIEFGLQASWTRRNLAEHSVENRGVSRH